MHLADMAGEWRCPGLQRVKYISRWRLFGRRASRYRDKLPSYIVDGHADPNPPSLRLRQGYCAYCFLTYAFHTGRDE
jgi:hypothetical protein